MRDNDRRSGQLALAGLALGMAGWQAIRRLRELDVRDKVVLVTCPPI